MWGNVSLLMGTIGMAVVFAILLVTANAMMMSARERTGEIGGAQDDRLHRPHAVRAGDARGRQSSPLTGAIIGLGGAKLLYKATNFNAAGFLPGFDVTGRARSLLGAGVALLLMLASGLVPAVRAARLPVVQALRRVE